MPLTFNELWDGAVAAVGKVFAAAYGFGWIGLLVLAIIVSVAWTESRK